MAVAAYPTIGSDFPPKKEDPTMHESVSTGKILLASMTAADLAESTQAKIVVKKKNGGGGDAQIQDPAFTRGLEVDSIAPEEDDNDNEEDEEVPVMEAIQTESDSDSRAPQSEFEVPEDVDTVVEESDGAEWPEA